jgi:hypothetical protein
LHYHLTEPQFLISGFILLLGIIFALAAFVELRAKKHPPFGSFFCVGLDRNLFAKIGFSEPEIPRPDRQKVFADIDDSYLDLFHGQAETDDIIQARSD